MADMILDMYLTAHDGFSSVFNSLSGLLGDAISKSMDYGTMIAQVANNTNMTATQTQQMSQAITQMANDSAAPIDQLANGWMHITNIMGNDTANATEVLKQAMESAVSTGGNVGDTANVLAAAMHEFNMQTSDAARAMDVLHESAALGNATLEQFVDGSARVLGMTANLGGSFTEVDAALSALTRHGFPSVSQAATQMVGILQHITNPTKQVREALIGLSTPAHNLYQDFSEAGLQTKGLSGIMADVKAVIGDNTSEWERLIPATRGGLGAMALAGTAFKDFKDTLTTLNDTWAGQLTPTATSYGVIQQTLGFQASELHNNFDYLLRTIGDAFVPILLKLTQTAIPIVQHIAEWVKTHQDLVIKIVASVAAVGALFAGLTALLPVFMALSTGVGQFIAALALSLPAIALFISHFRDIQSWLRDLWSNILDDAMTLWYRLNDMWMSISADAQYLWSDLYGGLTGIWGNIVSDARNIWNGITGTLGHIWDGISKTWNDAWSGVGTMLHNLWTGITGAAGTMHSDWDGVSGFLGGVWGTIRDGWSGFWSNIGTLLQGAWSAITGTGGFLHNAWDGVSGFLGGVWGTIREGWSGFWDNIGTTLHNVWNGITGTGGFLHNAWDGVSGFLGGVWGTIRDGWSGFWNNVGSMLGTVWGAITDPGKTMHNAWDGVGKFFSDVWGAISTTWQDFWTGIGSILQAAWGAITDPGKTMHKAWDGVNKFFNDVWGGISTAWQNFWTGLGSTLNNLWNGITSATGTMHKAWDGVGHFLGGVWGTIEKDWSKFWDGIKTMLHGSWDGTVGKDGWLHKLWDGVGHFLGGIWGNISDAWSNLWSGIGTNLYYAWSGTVGQGGWLHNLWDGVSKFLGDVWGTIDTAWSKLWSGITTMLQKAWDGITQAGGTMHKAWDGVSGFFGGIWKDLNSTWDTLWNKTIEPTLGNAWNNIAQLATSIWNDISQPISDVWNNVSGFFSVVWGSISSALIATWNTLSKTAATWGGKILDAFTGVFQDAGNAASVMWNNAIAGGANILGSIENNPLVKGLQSMLDGVGTWISNMWNQAVQWGDNLVHSIANGIYGGIHWVIDKLNDLMNTIKEHFPQSPAKRGPFATLPTFNWIGDQIKAAQPHALQAMNDLHGALNSTFNNNGLAGLGGFAGVTAGSPTLTALSIQNTIQGGTFTDRQSQDDLARALSDRIMQNLRLQGVIINAKG